jgi:hypothetical protein
MCFCLDFSAHGLLFFLAASSLSPHHHRPAPPSPHRNRLPPYASSRERPRLPLFSHLPVWISPSAVTAGSFSNAPPLTSQARLSCSLFAPCLHEARLPTGTSAKPTPGIPCPGLLPASSPYPTTCGRRPWPGRRSPSLGRRTPTTELAPGWD